jgi:hypothetical protein
MNRKTNTRKPIERKPAVVSPDPNLDKIDVPEDKVEDLPPANPFDEPIVEEYPDGGEPAAASLIPSETVVEHPLSPTDANPNPHGTRDEPFVAVALKGKDGETVVTEPDEGSVSIVATASEVHLGDGRVLHEGASAKVQPALAKQLVDEKKAKRG